MKEVGEKLRRLRPFILMVFSALLFLLGATYFNHIGGKTMAEFGVMGAVAAVAVIAAFRA